MKTNNEDQIMRIMENRIDELEEWLENPLDVPDTERSIQKEKDRLEEALSNLMKNCDEARDQIYADFMKMHKN